MPEVMQVKVAELGFKCRQSSSKKGMNESINFWLCWLFIGALAVLQSRPAQVTL